MTLQLLAGGTRCRASSQPWCAARTASTLTAFSTPTGTCSSRLDRSASAVDLLCAVLCGSGGCTWGSLRTDATHSPVAQTGQQFPPQDSRNQLRLYSYVLKMYMLAYLPHGVHCCCGDAVWMGSQASVSGLTGHLLDEMTETQRTSALSSAGTVVICDTKRIVNVALSPLPRPRWCWAEDWRATLPEGQPSLHRAA